MTTQKMLEENVCSLLEDLKVICDEGTLYDWLDDVLDVEYTKDLNGYFVGCNIAVTLGGPSVYVNTVSGDIEGYWGCDFARVPMPDDIRFEIDEVIEDIVANCA